MGRYLKFIGFLVLAFIVWQTSGAAFADGSSAGVEESVDIRTAPVAAHHQEEACFTSPRLPYLPVAELASNNGHVQLLTMSRIQRSYITEYIFSLRTGWTRLPSVKRFYRCIERSFLMLPLTIVASLCASITFSHCGGF